MFDDCFDDPVPLVTFIDTSTNETKSFVLILCDFSNEDKINYLHVVDELFKKDILIQSFQLERECEGELKYLVNEKIKCDTYQLFTKIQQCFLINIRYPIKFQYLKGI